MFFFMKSTDVDLSSKNLEMFKCCSSVWVNKENLTKWFKHFHAVDSDNDTVIVDVLEIFIQQKPFSTVSSIERDAQNNDNDIKYVVKDECQVRLVNSIERK